jgi:hypothetical protein
LVVPEGRSSKLDRLTPWKITNPEMTEKEHETAERQMRQEVLEEIEKDWADLK